MVLEPCPGLTGRSSQLDKFDGVILRRSFIFAAQLQ